MSNSLFGADFGDSIYNNAYDLIILNEIEKDDKEIALRELYKDSFNSENYEETTNVKSK